MRIRFHSKASDPGQASLELALIMPLVVIVVAATVWVAAVVRMQLHLDHLAYHAGRLAATATGHAELDKVVAAAIDSGDPSGVVGYELTIDDDIVTVDVRRRAPAPPLVARLVSNHTLHSSASFRLEYDWGVNPTVDAESR